MSVARIFVRNDIAEQFPALTFEACHAHRLDRVEIRRAGVDLDPLEHHRQLDVLQIGRLPHDIGARKIIAALFEHHGEEIGDRVGIGIGRIEQIAAGIVFFA